MTDPPTPSPTSLDTLCPVDEPSTLECSSGQEGLRCNYGCFCCNQATETNEVGVVVMFDDRQAIMLLAPQRPVLMPRCLLVEGKEARFARLQTSVDKERRRERRKEYFCPSMLPYVVQTMPTTRPRFGDRQNITLFTSIFFVLSKILFSLRTVAPPARAFLLCPPCVPISRLVLRAG